MVDGGTVRTHTPPACCGPMITPAFHGGHEVTKPIADSPRVDHIVIGSHGRSGPSRVLLGSVTERVARRAPVPVTIVR
ncbi:hypothetical protein JCM18750_37640 [Halostagnicola bangensis]